MANDLISRKALLEIVRLKMQGDAMSRDEMSAIEWAENEVLEAPTVDAAPVRHGRWIEGTLSSRLICSECGHEAKYNENANEPYFTKFCPECGARMDA